MTGWRLRCTVCSREWKLEVGYDLSEFEKIYLYCSSCKRNTMHEVLEKVESE